jgi:WD40 repeat protein
MNVHRAGVLGFLWLLAGLWHGAFAAGTVTPVLRRGPGPALQEISFAPDGQHLLVASSTGWITLFDVASGAEVWRFSRGLREDGPTVAVSQVAADLRHLALGLADAAEIWDAGTGERLLRVSVGPGPTKVELSSDARFLTAYTAGAIGVWDVATGAPLGYLLYSVRDIQSVHLSPDGALLAIARSGEIAVYSLANSTTLWREPQNYTFIAGFRSSGELIVQTTQPGGARGGLLLLDARSGRILRQGFTGCGQDVMTWAPHGRFVACFGLNHFGEFPSQYHDGFMIRPVLAEGAPSAARIVDPRGEDTTGDRRGVRLALAADGSRLAVGEGRSLRIWDAETGKALLDRHDRLELPVALEMTPKGEVLAVRTASGYIASFGLKVSTALRLANPKPERGPTAIAARANSILSLGTELVRTDMATGREEQCKNPIPQPSLPRGLLRPSLMFDSYGSLWGQDLRVAEDLSRAIAVNHPLGLYLHVLDPLHCRYLKRISTNRIWADKSYSAVALSPDGRYSAMRFGAGEILLGPTDSGFDWRPLKLPAMVAFSFSSNSRSLALASADGQIFLVPVADGKAIGSFRSQAQGISALRYSADGSVLMIGTVAGEIHLVDVASRRETSFTAHTDAIVALAASGDGLIATAGGDGTVALWEGSPQKLLARIILFEDGGWAVIDPEGRFDTNNFATLEEILQWRPASAPFSQEPAQAFLPDFFSPQLLSRRVLHQDLPPLGAPLEARDLAQPQVEVTAVKPGSDPSQVTVTVALTSSQQARTLAAGTRDAPGRVADLSVFRNGRLVGIDADPLAHGRPTQTPGQIEIDFPGIPLPTGGDGWEDVEFSAYAFNGDRVKSATARLPYPPGKLAARARQAYLLSFAVGEAQDPSWGLWFSVSDAASVESLLAAGLRGSYEVHTQRFFSRPEDDGGAVAGEREASKASLRSALAALAPGAANPKPATPDDVVVLFVSSHGYVAPDGTFYLIPSDTGSLGLSTRFLDLCAGPKTQCSAESQREAKEFLDRAISAKELADWLRPIDAGAVVLILDTCHSAAAAGLEYKPGPMGDATLGQLYYDKRMLALAAAEEQSPALGTFQLGRSLLAQALLKAAESSGGLDLRVWLAEAARLLPDLYERHFAGSPFPPQVPRLYDFTAHGTGAVLDPKAHDRIKPQPEHSQ